MQRRAGQQQGLAALMAAAGDNPLTRSWSDLVTGGVIQLAQGPYGPGLVERGDVSESRTAALRRALLAGQPKRASTELGEVMRQYGLGSSVAAYGAVAAAVAGMVAAADALHRGGPEKQQCADELATGSPVAVSAVG